MKSAKLIIPALALLLGSTAMVGCVQNNTPAKKETKVTNVAIRGYKNTVYLHDTPTLQLQAVVTPTEATNKNVRWSSGNVDVAEVSQTGLVTFKTTGQAKIICTSVEDESIKAEVTMTVKEDISQDMTLVSLVEPALMDSYGARTAKLDKIENIQTNKNPNRTTYYENEEGEADSYKVGNQNAFNFNVKATFVDPARPDADPVTYDGPKLVVKFSKYNETTHEYEELTDAAAAELVTVANDLKSFTFKNNVKGLFEVKVDADKTYYRVDEHVEPVSFKFEVVDGFNVYTAKQLSAFDNSVKFNDSTKSYWDDIKASEGLTDVDAKGIVLQADLTITNSDLPSEFFVTEAAVNQYATNAHSDLEAYVNFYKTYDPSFDEAKAKAQLTGSLYDCVSVFTRNTTEDTHFNFEGNYFKVDASTISQVRAFWSQIGRPLEQGDMPGAQVSKEGGTEGSHAELFGINWSSDNSTPADLITWSKCSGGEVNFKNTTFIGNGERSDDNKYIGGLINFKGEGTDFSFTNVLSSKTFITFMSNVRGENEHDEGQERVETRMTVDRCKNFDSYNSLVYIWGSQHNLIKNSFMTGAGGGIFLMDEPGANSDKETSVHYKPEVDCQNVYFENKVTGTEPWFSDHNASSYVQTFIKLGSKDAYKTSEQDPGYLGWIGRNAKESEGKTYVSKDSKEMSYVNLIALDICADAFKDNDKRALGGRFTINNGPTAYSLGMSKLDDPTNILAQFKQGLVDQDMGVIVETQYGAGLVTKADLSDGAIVANMAALMEDQEFSATCDALDQVLDGFKNIMAEQLGQMTMLESYSTSNQVNLDPNSPKYISTVFTPLVQSIIRQKVVEGVVENLMENQGMTKEQAEAYVQTPDGQTIVDNQYAQAWGAAEQGVATLQSKIAERAINVRKSIASGDYMGMYLKPGKSVNYIGMVMGLE